MLDTEDILKTVSPLIKNAGVYIRENCKQIKKIECKSSPTDLVTEVDKKVEQMLFEGIGQIYPTHKFIGEESFEPGHLTFPDEPTWIIDPVDGTTNYIHSYPYVAISVALTYQKKVILGIIYNPFKNQFYHAMVGKGAFCNDEQIKVSDRTNLASSLIIVDGAGQTQMRQDAFKENISFLLENCHGIRLQGSAALNMCTVAKGESDGYFQYGIHCWDIAAGALIVQEAGGVCVDPEGGPLNIMNRRVLCTSSSPIAEELTRGLKHISLDPDTN